MRKSPAFQTNCHRPRLTVSAVNDLRRTRMTEDRLSRLGPLCAVLFFVLTMGGFAIGAAGGGASVTRADSAARVRKPCAATRASGVGVGAYLTVISLAAF